MFLQCIVLPLPFPSLALLRSPFILPSLPLLTATFLSQLYFFSHLPSFSLSALTYPLHFPLLCSFPLTLCYLLFSHSLSSPSQILNSCFFSYSLLSLFTLRSFPFSLLSLYSFALSQSIPIASNFSFFPLFHSLPFPSRTPFQYLPRPPQPPQIPLFHLISHFQSFSFLARYPVFRLSLSSSLALRTTSFILNFLLSSHLH